MGFIVDLPRLVLQETRVDVVAAIGQSALPRATLQVGTENGEPVGYTITRSSGYWDGWLVGPTSGQAPGTLTFDLAPGTVTDPWTYSVLLALWPTDGGWASEAAGEARPRPARRDAGERPLRAAGRSRLPRPSPSTSRWPTSGRRAPGPPPPTSPGSRCRRAASRAAAPPWPSTGPASPPCPLGTHAATVRFTLDMGSGATAPLEVPVTLDLQLARTLHAMPRALVVGLGGDVLVHGSDFPSGFTGPVLFGGRPATAVRRITDRTLRVTPPAGLALGTWPVRVENPLGLDRSDAEVVVVAPAPARAAAARASPGAKVGLRFDDATGTLWVANAGTGTVERYREAAGWAKAGDGSDERSLPGVKAIAIAPDGATLVGAGRDRLPAPRPRLPGAALAAAGGRRPGQRERLPRGERGGPGRGGGLRGPDQRAGPGARPGDAHGAALRQLQPRHADRQRRRLADRRPDLGLRLPALGRRPRRRRQPGHRARRFGGLDRNADRLLVYGEVWRDPGDVFRTTSVLYDTATWNAVPGSVAGAIEPTAPVGAPPPTLAVVALPARPRPGLRLGRRGHPLLRPRRHAGPARRVRRSSPSSGRRPPPPAPTPAW